MTKITTTIIFTATLFFLTALVEAHAGDVWIYVNSSNQEEINLDLVRKIVQSNRLSWKNGENIVLISEELGQIDEDEFQQFSEITKSHYMNNWRLKFFSGRALIPIQLKKNTSPLKTLQENASSIFFTFKPLAEEDLGKSQIKSVRLSY